MSNPAAPCLSHPVWPQKWCKACHPEKFIPAFNAGTMSDKPWTRSEKRHIQTMLDRPWLIGHARFLFRDRPGPWFAFRCDRCDGSGYDVEGEWFTFDGQTMAPPCPDCKGRTE